MQHDQRGRNRCRIHGDHNGGVLRKAQIEEVRRDDIHQVRNNEWQAGRICNKSCSHDKGQCRALAEPQCEQHRNHNRRQDQRGAIIGEQSSNSGTEQDYPGEQQAATSVTPAGDVQCGPFKEAGLIEQQADDDDRNKCRCRVPDDIPDNGNISDMDDTGSQRQHSPDTRAPTNTQASGLPDHQYQRQ